MEVCIGRIILKNIGMASEKLYRNTLSTVREVFRGRVGCLESIFSHDGTSWRVLVSSLKRETSSAVRGEPFSFWWGGGGRGAGGLEDLKKISCSLPSKEKKFNAWPALTIKNHVCMVHPKKILTNHRQPIPTSSLAESESFTYKLCSFIQ